LTSGASEGEKIYRIHRQYEIVVVYENQYVQKTKPNNLTVAEVSAGTKIKLIL